MTKKLAPTWKRRKAVSWRNVPNSQRKVYLLACGHFVERSGSTYAATHVCEECSTENPSGERQCPQCWKTKSDVEFYKSEGGFARQCQTCRSIYNNWSTLSAAERCDRIAKFKPRVDAKPRGLVTFVPETKNVKLGAMPLSISERGTCPPSCAFFTAACYANYGKLGSHWDNVTKHGVTWKQFIAHVAKLEPGTVWRHNEAGDLAGRGEKLDHDKLVELVMANRGRRGFTYTHKTRELLAYARESVAKKRSIRSSALGMVGAISGANRAGFIINLSADSLEEVDLLSGLDIAPVVVTVAPDVQLPARTPGGRKLVTCPYETHKIQCVDCQLCAKPRKSIVVFRAHGQASGLVTELVRRKREVHHVAA